MPTRLRSLMARVFPDFSSSGLLLGALFFLASLTPGLVPRSNSAQALVSGACLAVVYGLGVLIRWLWIYLELRLPRFATTGGWRKTAIAVSAAIFALALWCGQAWSNVITELMHLPPAGAS